MPTEDVVPTRTHVGVDVESGVARVRFLRPAKRNAITAQMWSTLVDVVGGLAVREDVTSLVVSGSGGSFSAGADLSAVHDSSGTESPEFRALAEEGIRVIREFPRPTVAVVDGACVGAGCLVALACDVRFATPAGFFAIPAVKYGLVPEEHGLARLVELVGSGQATRFLLGSERWTAAEAAERGLVEVCAEDAEQQAAAFTASIGSADLSALLRTRAAISRLAAAAGSSGSAAGAGA